MTSAPLTRIRVERAKERLSLGHARLAGRLHDVVSKIVGVHWVSGLEGTALTFDDGPHEQYTPALLDILERHGVRATFFVTGLSAQRHPDIVKRAAAMGHAVGSHSMSHPFIADCGFFTVLSEYRNGRKAVERVLGRSVKLFRPPGSDLGYRSLIAMSLLGLRPYLYSKDPEDWVPGSSTRTVLDVLDQLTVGDIMLLHDSIELPVDQRSLDRSATLNAVNTFLSKSAASHRFVTLG